MLLIGVILLIVGIITGIGILWTIGIILTVIGAVLWIMGSMGHAVAGRRPTIGDFSLNQRLRRRAARRTGRRQP